MTDAPSDPTGGFEKPTDNSTAASATATGDSDDTTCYRCGDSLFEAHRIRLSAVHSGSLANRCLDVERRICLDCLAAIGLLEFDRDELDRSPDGPTPATGECPPIRSRLG